MKKCINNRNFKIVLFILILIKIVFFILNKIFNIYVLILDINQTNINLVLNISIIIIFMLIINYNGEKATRYLMNSIATISIIILLFLNPLFDMDTTYFYFQAPDKSRTLVVEESSFLLGGWSNFYERKGLIFIKDLKSRITTDDGYRPFSNNHYNLKWLDNNSVELNYDFGAGGKEYKKEIIKFN